MTSTVPRIFDPGQVARNRTRARDLLADADFLFTRAGADLGGRLHIIRTPPQKILILGRRGAECLLTTRPKSGETGPDITLCDVISYPPEQSGFKYVLGDHETLPFASKSFDAILSILDLHTVNDLPGMLTQIRNALKPGGFFLGNLLGGETLSALRTAMTEAELELRGGVSPRIAPFADRQQVSALMQRAGFDLPVVDSDILTIHYRSLIRLFHDLRAMGEGNAIAARDKRIPPRLFFPLVEKIYTDKFSDPDGLLPVRFEIISMIGWAPS